MTLFSALQRDPDTTQISLAQIMSFTRLLSTLKHDITLCQPINVPTSHAPAFLPPTIATFISQATDVSLATVPKCWRLLKDDVWSLSQPKLSSEEEDLFRKHGWKLGITSTTLFPPSHHCQNLHCTRTNPLRKAESRQIVIYTLGNGVLPAWAVHLYCPDCNTNYHYNYSVHDGTRTYYGDTPIYIQIGEHQFAERKLIGLWVSLMLVAWVSATNCSRSYDMALSEQQERDFAAGGWQFGCTLTTDHVWDSFIILTLLDYNDRKNTCLQVPHIGEQKDRFTAAMRARNLEVIEQGQDEIGHCCDKCQRVWTRPDGSEYDVQVVVGDGLAMGFIKCQAPHCTLELENNRHKFCAQHRHLDNICSIVGCNSPVIPGKKSCSDEQHTKMERLHFERGRAAFTLRDRLQRHRLNHPSVETAIDEEDDGVEWFDVDGEAVNIQREQDPGSIGVDDNTPCESSKSDTGNRKYKALFVQKAFSVPRAHKPEHFVYDTNCDAKQQVMAHPDEWSWFQDVGMTVDVFHFLHKHKIGHTFCQEHCNPVSCPELMGPDGRTWFFNTSVAEQTNVWLGGYHAMCREMLPVKYSFFLDEMIRPRNQLTVAKLREEGQNPRERVRRP
ncbi:hypothetical protein C8R44DRAFT_892286 [Mycena epipterygia]|nr:hypothetical protein C8R44DRAFT_892286 [Mycena epipterygia]